MVEVKFDDDDEELQEKLKILEENCHSLDSVLRNYADAVMYDWDKYIEIYPEVKAMYSVRCDLLELINQLDEKIDDFIESIEEKQED